MNKGQALQKIKSGELCGKSLRGASLRGKDLSDARLRDVDLSGADLTGAILNGADFQGALLVGAKLDGVCAESANFSNADLSCLSAVSARFTDCDFRSSNLDRAQMPDSILQGSTFCHCKGIEVDFSMTQITDSDFSESQIRYGDFWGARLQKVDFSSAWLEGTIFDVTDQKETTYQNADLTGASLKNIEGLDKDFVKALKLQGVKSGIVTFIRSNPKLRRRFLILVCIIALCFAPGNYLYKKYVPSAWRSDTLIDATWKALENDRPDLARKYLKIVTNRREFGLGLIAVAYLLEGRLAELEGNLKRAKASYQSAFNIADDDINNYLEALYSLARLEFEMNYLEKAMDHAKILVLATSQEPLRQTHYYFEGLRIQSKVLIQQNQFLKVIDLLAPELHSSDPETVRQASEEIIHALGRQLESMNGSIAIQKVFQDLSRVEPTIANRQINLSIQMAMIYCLTQLERFDEAIDQLKAISKMVIKVDDVPQNLEMLTMITNRFPEKQKVMAQQIVQQIYQNIVAQFRKEVRSDQRYHWASVQLGNIYFARQQYEKAMAIWKRTAAESADLYPRIHSIEGIVNVLIGQKRFEEAKAAAQSLESEPQDPHAGVMASVLEAKISNAQGRVEPALKILGRELETCSDEWSCCMLLQNKIQFLIQSSQVSRLEPLLQEALERWDMCEFEIDQMHKNLGR